MTDITTMCLQCAAGHPEFCENPTEVSDQPGWIVPCRELFTVEEIVKDKPRKDGSNVASPGDVTDARSTGRKRAAMLLPIQTGRMCDWSGLKWAGGGVYPIVGCDGNTLADVKSHSDLPDTVSSRGERHHGPNKAVLDNAVGVNLHGICSTCHQRWHALNDPAYTGDRPTAEFEWLPSQPYYAHDPYAKVTAEERALVDAWWATPVKDRGDWPIDLPDEERLKYPTDASSIDNNPFEEPSSLLGESES